MPVDFSCLYSQFNSWKSNTIVWVYIRSQFSYSLWVVVIVHIFDCFTGNVIVVVLINLRLVAVRIRLLVVNVADHVVVVSVVHLYIIWVFIISKEKLNLWKQHGLLHLSTNDIQRLCLMQQTMVFLMITIESEDDLESWPWWFQCSHNFW